MESMTKKQANILASIKAELEDIKEECKVILQGDYFPLKAVVIALNAHLIGADVYEKYHNGIRWINEKIFDKNYIEDPNAKSGYAYKYDIRTIGSYCGTYKTKGYKGELVDEDYYKNKLIDRFHSLLSIVYYDMEDLPIDYRPNAPTPCSACDLAESYRLADEHEDEDEDE